MSDVEVIALWTGLFVGIASIVLAVVAILFTAAVERRAREASLQLVQSLQKIETTVERLSRDTVDLIQVAWERMLGNVDGSTRQQNVTIDQEALQSLMGGIAAEVRSTVQEQLAQQEAGGSLEEMLSALESSLSLMDEGLDRQATTDQFQATVDALDQVSPYAREFARQLASGPQLTRKEYSKLLHPSRSNARTAIAELRRAGLITPLKGPAADGDPEPVYWFKPGMGRYVIPALVMLDHDPTQFEEEVEAILALTGWGRTESSREA